MEAAIYIPLSRIKEYRCLKNLIHQIDSKTEWFLLSASFTAKFELVFVLTLENAFSQRIHFEANRKSTGFLRNGTRNFLNSPPFERSACFSATICENLERFQYFNLKQIFQKTKTFFRKLEYPFLVESTKIENASFPYKTVISGANVKTNRMVSSKWTYAKNEVLLVTSSFFESFVSV